MTSISTRYYRTIPPNVENAPEYYANYRPYHVFCLNTILDSYCMENNLGLTPRFTSSQYNNKMYLYVSFRRGNSNEDEELDEETTQELSCLIDSITGNMENPNCLLLDSQLRLVEGGELIPEDWLRKIIPYINLNDQLDVSLLGWGEAEYEYGTELIRHDYSTSLSQGISNPCRFRSSGRVTRLFVDLSEVTPYTKVYNMLFDKAIERIREYWRSGIGRAHV